jgi:hypothetical protein
MADTQAPDPTQVMAGMPQTPPDIGQSQPQMPTLAPPQPMPQAQASEPPTPRPILVDLIKGLIHPQAQNLAAARPTSRTDVLENFLGNFMNALGSGFANEGRGPGAVLRGAGAAMGAPYQQSLQNFQLGQQAQENQARIAGQQAQTQLTQAQAGAMPAELQAKIAALSSQPRVDPSSGRYLGTMNDAQYQNYLKGQGAASVTAANRLSVEQLKAQILLGQVKRVEDYKDPQTGQMGKMAYNLKGEPMGVLPGSLPSSSYLPKSTSTVDFKEDDQGNIIALPKTSTSGPVIPGPAGSAGATPSGFPKGGASSGSPRIVAKGKTPAMVTGTGPDGRQIAGTPDELRAAGATGVTKLEAGDASKVSIARQMTGPGGLFDLAEKDLARFKPGELEALAPRWNEFLAGKVGTADPRFIALRTHVNGLLGTALMQAHVGSKGGEAMMEHFEDIANTGKMSADTLRAALGAEKQYVEEKAMRPGAPAGKVDSLLKKYGG